MIIDSTAFATIPGLTQASLTESADDVSELTLEFAGFGPDWLEYMQPVTVMHQGRVLFHGKITSYSRNNDSGEVTSAATVSNLLWLLDHQTLGAQIAEVQAAAENEAWSSLQSSANVAMASWTSLAASCRIDAPGWVVNDDGTEAPESIITLDASRARYSFGAYMERERAITAWTAMQEMKTCNPDCTYRVNYTTGAVEVISISKADTLTWDTQQEGVISASGISPQYEATITGVVVIVSWHTEKGASGIVVRKYPDNLDLAQIGVKVYTASAESAFQAGIQADYLARQCQAYYEATNSLQWGGSIAARLADIPASPLCSCLNLTGRGTHASWHSMGAVVTEVEWDFVELTCTLTLGRTVDEPDLHELQFEDKEESGSSGGGDGGGGDEGGGDDGGDMDSDSTTQEDLTMDVDLTTLEDSTTEEEETTAEEGSASGSASGSGSGSIPPSTGSGSGSTPPSTGSGSSSGQGSGSSPVECDCGGKWKELDEWKQSIEDRLAALENGEYSTSEYDPVGGTCACGCNSELQEIKNRLETVENRTITFDTQWFSVSGQNVSFNSAGVRSAVNNIITGVSINVTAEGLSETTAYGTIAVNTSGGGDLGSASFNSSVHY